MWRTCFIGALKSRALDTYNSTQFYRENWNKKSNPRSAPKHFSTVQARRCISAAVQSFLSAQTEINTSYEKGGCQKLSPAISDLADCSACYLSEDPLLDPVSQSYGSSDLPASGDFHLHCRCYKRYRCIKVSGYSVTKSGVWGSFVCAMELNHWVMNAHVS